MATRPILFEYDTDGLNQSQHLRIAQTLATTSNAGDSRRNSRSRKRMSDARRR